jgi:hypothetical protein
MELKYLFKMSQVSQVSAAKGATGGLHFTGGSFRVSKDPISTGRVARQFRFLIFSLLHTSIAVDAELKHLLFCSSIDCASRMFAHTLSLCFS